MEVADGRSSSNDLSSAPPSDAESTPGPLTYLTAHRAGHTGTPGVSHHLPLQTRHSPLAGAGVATSASATLDSSRQDQGATQPTKRPRKKRDPSAAPAETDKKPRAARRPRGASTTGTGSRKRTKVESVEETGTVHINRHNATGLQSSTLIQPVSFSPQASLDGHRDDAARVIDSGLSMSRPGLHSPTSHQRPYEFNPQPSASTQPPAQPAAPRSSAIYDPIRSITIQRPIPSTTPSATGPPAGTPPRPIYNPSTSPAISGIIHHPSQPTLGSPSTAAGLPLKTEPHVLQTNGKLGESTRMNGNASAMDVDSEQGPPRKLPGSKKVPSEAPTRTTSPKPTRAKEQPPPPPMGSGLLSASLFGGDSSLDMSQKDSGKGPSIVLHIDLKDPNNRVINFARMAEEKYGFAALYPRQAAQKERLAKIAAAGAALERSASGSKFGGTSAGDSGDEDLSVDIERDSENDGDVAMSGVNGGQEAPNSGTDGPGPKRRRRRKVEEYDQDDPFVDDSELLWEAQAAASKDGFFVYCGPLVPEGEKPAVERADGTIKRGRGRGRGGGPGSRGGRGGATGERSGRGGGPGSRGGGVTRKPRITKDERAQLEREKLQREKMAPLIARPAAYPG